MTDREDLDDDVLYYVEHNEPAYGHTIAQGRLIRKTGMDRAAKIRPATQADVDAWPEAWGPLELPWSALFADGTTPRRPPR